MIAILGTGYIASALVREARRRNRAVYVLSRSSVDYTKFAHLRAFLADARPELLINAAGFVGHPNGSRRDVSYRLGGSIDGYRRRRNGHKRELGCAWRWLGGYCR